MGLAAPRRGCPRGGRVDARPALSRPSRDSHPTPTPCPATPPWGCATLRARPAVPHISLPLRPPLLPAARAPETRTPSSRALIYPRPGSAWNGLSRPPSFINFPCRPWDTYEGNSVARLRPLFPELLAKPRRPLPRVQTDLGGRAPCSSLISLSGV